MTLQEMRRAVSDQKLVVVRAIQENVQVRLAFRQSKLPLATFIDQQAMVIPIGVFTAFLDALAEARGG